MSETAWALTLETPRLILRPQQPSDYEAWRAGYEGRSPSRHRHDEGRINLSSCNAAWFAEVCQSHQRQAQRDYAYIFAIFAKETQQHLGYVDLSTIQREEKQWANLGYTLHNQHWRQGFGKEAVKAALRAGFEHLRYHRIEAAINLDNEASIALARRVGMQQECVRRSFYYEGGQWVDHAIYVALPFMFELSDRPPAIAPVFP